jgi:hypothetical protein
VQAGADSLANPPRLRYGGLGEPQEDSKMEFTRIAMMLAAAGMIASTSALLADASVTPAEAEKIKAALEVWGCTGGKMEKETDASGFDVDDAQCKAGQYDFELNANFEVTSITPSDAASK